MKISKDNLISHLESACKTAQKNRTHSFPRDTLNYFIEYSAFEQRMNTYVHNNVTSGAISIDRGRLTEHGVDHIRRVIRQCSTLVNGSQIELSPYEVFLLLLSIHVHDIGNILGRKDHEKNAGKVLSASEFGPRDRGESNAILSIASAHKGDEEDTIGALPTQDHVMGQRVHFQKLAALVRLADELADDCTRADLISSAMDSLVVGAQIFHLYASGLHSVTVDHEAHQITMRFEFSWRDFMRPWGKGERKTYLMHEILRRTAKVYTEAQYTTQFLLPSIVLRRVSVGIKIYDGHDLVDEFGYRISTDGLISSCHGTIYDLSPELTDASGKSITARSMRNRLKEAMSCKLTTPSQ